MGKIIILGSKVKFVSLEELHVSEYVQRKSKEGRSTYPTSLVISQIKELVANIVWRVEKVGDKIVLNSLEFREKLSLIKESCGCWDTKKFITKVIRFFYENKFIVRPEYLKVVW